ncbi:hypothetical protein QO202_04635 [Aeromonas caviae]|uniref:hypothetical protein n=1 Tax=Aeromonas caviae TaxID=648 RepID=UPI0026491089|nr:hypothetical protein [Aeromonas caviae]MDN6867327.1 hypothetical protein [Aeromonas caviae]
MKKHIDEVCMALRDFQRDTATHTMRVHRDDGLYRHIEFSNGGSSVYRFDLITWPGYLTICGDMGTWTFSRTSDMFEFFGGNLEKGINPRYWGEKLQLGAAGRRDEICMEFDEESFRSGLREWLTEYQEENDSADAIASTINKLCEESYSNEHQACQALFDSDIPNSYDLMEGLTMKRYSHHYLWILHAIVWGIGCYNVAKQPA